MAKQIWDVRLKQKTGTYEEWDNNPLILLDGEVALVRTATGAIIQQRVGDGFKTFAELPDNIRYDQSAFISVNSPSKVTGNYTVVGAGTYNGVTVGADKIAVLYWNGTTWVKNFEGDLPKVDIVDGFNSTAKDKAGSADNDRALHDRMLSGVSNISLSKLINSNSGGRVNYSFSDLNITGYIDSTGRVVVAAIANRTHPIKVAEGCNISAFSFATSGSYAIALFSDSTLNNFVGGSLGVSSSGATIEYTAPSDGYLVLSSRPPVDDELYSATFIKSYVADSFVASKVISDINSQDLLDKPNGIISYNNFENNMSRIDGIFEPIDIKTNQSGNSYYKFNTQDLTEGEVVVTLLGKSATTTDVVFFSKQTASAPTYTYRGLIRDVGGTIRFNLNGVDDIFIKGEANGSGAIQGQLSYSVEITKNSEIDGIIDDYFVKNNINIPSNSKTPYNGFSLPKNPDELKILVIGNSFTNDTFQRIRQAIQAIDSAVASKVTLARVFYPSDNLQNQVSRFNSKSNSYGFHISEKGGEWQNIYTQNSNAPFLDNLASIQFALKYKKWDIVVFQQQSVLSGVYNSYIPYLDQLHERCRFVAENSSAKIAFNLTWAVSEKLGSRGQDYLNQNYEGKQSVMQSKLTEVSEKIRYNHNIDMVVPVYQAFDNARKNSTLKPLIDDLTISDGYHANSVGGYLSALTFIETLISPCFNISIKNSTYNDPTATVGHNDLLVRSARYAVAKPYSSSDISIDWD